MEERKEILKQIYSKADFVKEGEDVELIQLAVIRGDWQTVNMITKRDGHLYLWHICAEEDQLLIDSIKGTNVLKEILWAVDLTRKER